MTKAGRPKKVVKVLKDVNPMATVTKEEVKVVKKFNTINHEPNEIARARYLGQK